MKRLIKQYAINNMLPLLVLMVLTSGCGTTALVLKSGDTQADFSKYKSLLVRTTTEGAAAPAAAQVRIKNFVTKELVDCCVQRFSRITMDSNEPHDLVLNLKLTVYDEGNRFARFRLAGLGSMQIHAQVEVIEGESARVLTAGEAGKTFAWGGIYGAATGIEDIEKDFAKEVVKGFRESLRIEGAARSEEIGQNADQLP
jgi:hypothetical protein